MKKLTAITVGVVVGVSVWAQGVVNFNNTVSAAAKITDYNSDPLDGTAGWVVDLYYGAVGGDPTTFTSLGIAVPFSTGGTFAGFFAGDSQIIPGFPAGSQVAIQPRAWNLSAGATWSAAFNAMIGDYSIHVSPPNAAPVTVTLVSATDIPPPITNELVGYVGHSLMAVSEPSTFLLGIAGISGLLLLRRKLA